ncbi:hypothetical protein [Streptomyces sp. H27-D2]|uniref:hypothetical protein n=1 Tax=Streptomyces sp. H27-D2 TaxID=3046304 RepID=UPI002DBD5EA9|nr:hypothetical protein [Streptomyces sp. H27-D2]MEC4015326.1 hypothetical protein [Streptomyces sp. H27-D2]
MTLFLGLGIAGVVLLALALVFDGILEGLFGGVLEGLFAGLLSLPVIAGFVSMFGFGGAIVLGTTGLGAVVASAVGVVAGAVTGRLTLSFSRMLMRDQTTATPRGSDLIGSAGAVVTPIPAQGYGEVLLYIGGARVKYAARSAEPVARGAEIWVEATLSSTSVQVRTVER